MWRIGIGWTLATVLLLLLSASVKGQGSTSGASYTRPPDGSLRFIHEGVGYLFYDRPAPLSAALFKCHSNPNLLGGTGRLLTVDQVTTLFVEVAVSQPQLASLLIKYMSNATAYVPTWDTRVNMWLGNELHDCKGGALDTSSSPNYWVIFPVPCDWNLTYICKEGPPDPWVTSLVAVRTQPSTYRLGPEASGLQLMSTGQAYGMTEVPADAVRYDNDTARFWEQGPVLGHIFSTWSDEVRPSLLYCMRPVREGDTIDVWKEYENDCQEIDYYHGRAGPGATCDYLLSISDAADYVTTVEGCYSTVVGLQRLLLTTRTGRRMQLGRGECTNRFSEQAPAGGYLAGYRSWSAERYSNDTYVYSIAQVELVWALPWSASADVLPSPVVAVMSAPVLQAHSNPSPGSNGDSSSDPWQSCAAGARPMADLECGPSAGGAVCPSNQCCGPLPRDLAVAIGLEAFIGNRSFSNVCDESEYICTANTCLPEYGSCGTVPELHTTLLANTPPSGITNLFVYDKTVFLPYTAALEYCRSLGLLGLSWSLVTINDVMQLTSSIDTRGAINSTSRVYFWVDLSSETIAGRSDSDASGQNGTGGEQAGSSTCIEVTYYDMFAHILVPVLCIDLGISTMCKASTMKAAPVTTAAGATPVTVVTPYMASLPSTNCDAGPWVSPSVAYPWAPGEHMLEQSSSVGLGPFGVPCPFILGGIPPLPGGARGSDRGSSPGPLDGDSLPSNIWGLDGVVSISYVLQQPIASLAVSVAVQGDELVQLALVHLVSGLRVTRWARDPCLNSSVSGGNDTITAFGESSQTRRRVLLVGEWPDSPDQLPLGEPETAGTASTGGWHVFNLAYGEVVVSVSGCAGTFLERLVFRTSSGRLWTTPYTPASVCTAAFELTPPPLSYLVGLSGHVGQYVERLQVVWGRAPIDPVTSPPPPAPSELFPEPVPPPLPTPSELLPDTVPPPLPAPSVPLPVAVSTPLPAPVSRPDSVSPPLPAPSTPPPALLSRPPPPDGIIAAVIQGAPARKSDSGKTVGAAVGAACGGVLLVLGLLGLFLFLKRRRRGGSKEPKASQGSGSTAGVVLVGFGTAGEEGDLTRGSSPPSGKGRAYGSTTKGITVGGGACDAAEGVDWDSAKLVDGAAEAALVCSGGGLTTPGQSGPGSPVPYDEGGAAGEVRGRQAAPGKQGPGGAAAKLTSASCKVDGGSAPVSAAAMSSASSSTAVGAALGKTWQRLRPMETGKQAAVAALPADAHAGGGGGGGGSSSNSGLAAAHASSSISASTTVSISGATTEGTNTSGSGRGGKGGGLATRRLDEPAAPALSAAADAPSTAPAPSSGAVQSTGGSSTGDRGSSRVGTVGRAMDVVLVPSGGSASPAGPGSRGARAVAALVAIPPEMQLQMGRDVVLGDEPLLGRGASGVVRKGTLHLPDGRQVHVAVKLLDVMGGLGLGMVGSTDDDAGGGAAAAGGPVPRSLRLLADEVHVLSRLDHPNVVRFYGCCLDARCPFLVQELMCMPLSTVIHGTDRQGSWLYGYSLTQMLCIARDVAAGLAYLHPTVVHRDLKPGNCMLDADGNVKIGDFGLARFKNSTVLPTTNVEVGTTAYMAPELFASNETRVSDRADVYSLGLILWELCTRQRPWVGTRSAVIGYMVAMERQRPPLPPEDCPLCPPGLRSLIARCWRHNPEERPSAAEVAKRLTLMLAEQG